MRPSGRDALFPSLSTNWTRTWTLDDWTAGVGSFGSALRYGQLTLWTRVFVSSLGRSLDSSSKGRRTVLGDWKRLMKSLIACIGPNVLNRVNTMYTTSVGAGTLFLAWT
jgi:hypothetical protein